jgi:IS30 family transposase
MSNSPRKKIIELHKMGMATAKIVRSTGYVKTTVYRAVQRFRVNLKDLVRV